MKKVALLATAVLALNLSSAQVEKTINTVSVSDTYFTYETDKAGVVEVNLQYSTTKEGENMSDDFDFDFGFTAVNEDELQAVQDAQKTVGDVEVKATSTQEKLDKLYNAIQPLLTNLKKNPEKEYILWPNRVDKVDQFEDMLRKIYNS